jgi:hypothetical protein
MDRRRFVPSTEGLEGRALLATSLFGSASANNNPAVEVPWTFPLKVHRIERLPFHLEQNKPGRILPAATLKQLQNDLLDIAAKLHPPGSAVLEAYNSALRKVSPSSSLSVTDAHLLSHVFGRAVMAAGATPQQVANLQNDMNALAKVDANSPQPVFLATNDYTLVLETILAVGRPIRRPVAPQLAAHQGKRLNPNAGITTHHQPTLVGTYDAFNTIQIVDANGNVYGQAPVIKNGPTESNGEALATGRYTVTFDKPLADGLYTFYVRAVDSFGNVSHPSPPFKIKVVTPPRIQAINAGVGVPGGPLALKH